MRALMLDFQPRRRSGPLGWSLLAGGVVLALTCIVIATAGERGRPNNSKAICKPRPTRPHRRHRRQGHPDPG